MPEGPCVCSRVPEVSCVGWAPVCVPKRPCPRQGGLSAPSPSLSSPRSTGGWGGRRLKAGPLEASAERPGSNRWADISSPRCAPGGPCSAAGELALGRVPCD
ncbi:hypothetical protein KIL84_002663 [Mauremys mutica]|uniref:Uncharacterized protein n=1 Tax=Mauremys mutica TaxID=74926 RepID=A0A9D3WU99_9SAUR|nr:hypothetical protein KIL84_002663 [Mauremys mutica]